MAVLANGRLLIVGDDQSGYDSLDAILLKRDFTLDKTFGRLGKLNTFLTRIRQVEALPNGKVLVLGVLDGPHEHDGFTQQAYLLRLNPDGTTDLTFGTKGHVAITDVGAEAGTYYGYGYISPDDRAKFVLEPGGGILLFASQRIARFTPKGKRDLTFGVDGVLKSLSYPYLIIQNLAPLANGNIIVVGSTGPFYEPVIARVTRTGELDSSFGLWGFARPYLGGMVPLGALALPNGEVLVSGTATVFKVNVNSKMDETFGKRGVVQVLPLPFGWVLGGRMIVQPDGKTVVTGGNALIRFDTDGTLDPSFGVPLISLADGSNHAGVLWNEKTLLFLSQSNLLEIHTDGDDPTPIADVNHILMVNATPRSERISVSSDPKTFTTLVTMDSFGRVLDNAHFLGTKIFGGEGDDSIDASVVNDTIDGGGGNDFLRGSDFAETFIGGDGNDTIHAGGRGDLISGGAGADRLYGENGDDTISGNAQSDSLDGGAGRDRLAGNGGRDKLYDVSGASRLYGGEGADTLYGGAAYNTLYGEGGNDRLVTEGGGNELHGGAGDDTFFTAAGYIDELFGDGGHDTASADPDDVLQSIEAIL